MARSEQNVCRDVNAGLDVCTIGDSSHHDLNDFLRQRLALATAQHSWTTQMPRFVQRHH
jgi:putative NIF3 family GTP cyclohydrolase 1 type 2